MSNVSIESHGEVALVRMTRGATNAIGSGMVADLAAALDTVRAGSRGMVLAGGEKFFSIGLDLPELLGLDREAMAAFWGRFDDLVLALFTLPLPTAAAIRGHATAGGTILALACDDRLIASGRTLMGLNEVRIGLPVPYLPDLVLRQVVGDKAARILAYGGEFVAPEQAAAIALVDEVLPPADVEAVALRRVARLAESPRAAFAAIKAARVEAVSERFARNRQAKVTAMLDLWFDADTQRLLAEAGKRF